MGALKRVSKIVIASAQSSVKAVSRIDFRIIKRINWKILFKHYARFVVSFVMLLPIVTTIIYTIFRILRFSLRFPGIVKTGSLASSKAFVKIQPPAEFAERLGIKPGMTVLEIGPGRGTYTIAVARSVGYKGKVHAFDMSPGVIYRLKEKIHNARVSNIEAHQGSFEELPFEDKYFDAVYLIGTFHEIDNIKITAKEFKRVLKKKGILAINEVITAPEYTFSSMVYRKMYKQRFKYLDKIGNLFYYTLRFVK